MDLEKRACIPNVTSTANQLLHVLKQDALNVNVKSRLIVNSKLGQQLITHTTVKCCLKNYEEKQVLRIIEKKPTK